MLDITVKQCNAVEISLNSEWIAYRLIFTISSVFGVYQNIGLEFSLANLYDRNAV
jgi:hypothetical protein